MTLLVEGANWQVMEATLSMAKDACPAMAKQVTLDKYMPEDDGACGHNLAKQGSGWLSRVLQ